MIKFVSRWSLFDNLFLKWRNKTFFRLLLLFLFTSSGQTVSALNDASLSKIIAES